MAETESTETSNVAIVSLYSNYLRNRLRAFYPFHPSNLLRFLSNLAAPFRSIHHRQCIPLPLPSNFRDSSMIIKESRVHGVLEDILEHVLLNLHSIEKNLQFWQSKSEKSDASKAYFMVFERGPSAFINETAKLLCGNAAQGSLVQNLCQTASVYIHERLTVLSSLRYALATFLAQFYVEVDKIGEELVKDPQHKLPSLLVRLNEMFSILESSIGHLHAAHQTDSSVDGSYSIPLLFKKLPEINQEDSQWTDCEIRDAINSIYQNLQKLDSYISVLVTNHRKPRKITQYWIGYTCGAIGLSACSIWLLRHSSLMGSSDLDNWVQKAKDSTVGFYKDHVEQPILSIKDDLFETFKKQSIMDPAELELTSDKLHRMLLAFSERAKGQKFPENASDQEMLEIVMSRYEKEIRHPIQNLIGGELAEALLIQIQKLKLDIETAMLELAPPPPPLLFSLLSLNKYPIMVTQDKKAEGRGRIARIQRRLVVIEVEKRIMQYQNFVEQGSEKDAQCMFGLVLYSLNSLYYSVKKHAEDSGEWHCLREDLIDLARPGLQTGYKLTVTSRMKRDYDCIVPMLRRR
ncbi:protein DGS1, mitochondrial [Arachis ipaensis]|uniref:protein DGS1, mitochondrial n=1 Tax=Arachis ipaensis TaxID=130454 RepID=UPI0007AFB224|nr:protein DGS1, mitochondrial [Arachis ipaensis]